MVYYHEFAICFLIFSILTLQFRCENVLESFIVLDTTFMCDMRVVESDFSLRQLPLEKGRIFFCYCWTIMLYCNIESLKLYFSFIIFVTFIHFVCPTIYLHHFLGHVENNCVIKSCIFYPIFTLPIFFLDSPTLTKNGMLELLISLIVNTIETYLDDFYLSFLLEFKFKWSL